MRATNEELAQVQSTPRSCYPCWHAAQTSIRLNPPQLCPRNAAHTRHLEQTLFKEEPLPVIYLQADLNAHFLT